MSREQQARLDGSGAVAQGGGVAAGEKGVAIGGDVHGGIITTANHVTVVYQGAAVAIPSPEAVARHRAALRERLETDARTRWGGMSLYIQEEGATLPIEASPYQTGRLGPRENLLRLLHTAGRLGSRENLLPLLHTAGRLLVLGEPGSGKTVSLERLAWELCSPTEPAGPEPEPSVPVLVRLFHYAGTSLPEWVRASLQEMGHLRLDDERALAAFLQEGESRCFFLFDGLNEVPPLYRDRLVDELVRWMAACSRHCVVLTSRSQDEVWRRLRGEVNQTVVVQPIGDAQARGYLAAHLGEQRGGDLYERLDERLRAMARTPLVLWLIKEAGTAGEAVPGNRGELYARFVSRMLRRDTDRRMDAQIPERVKRQALAGLAYHLGLEQRLSCPREEAVEVVAWRLGEGQVEQADQVVGACARHGLLAGDDAVWFAPHHTVQEHFAALALQEEAQREWQVGRWGRLWRAAQRRLAGHEQGLARLAADDWWMETFVQLAGLVDDADRLAREVVRVNPWLAWWCVEEGRGVAEGTRQAVADRSIRLLESERVADRRRAVVTLSQVRNERVVRPLLRAAADPDGEVAGLAVQALVEMGEAVRGSVAEALRGTDRRLRLAALRYLVERPGDPLCQQVPWEEVLGQPMVWIPPGPFLMGSDKGKDPQAFDDELPQHRVTLPGYWIERYPVTVAQFRAFVEASGHKLQDPDSLKGPGDHPVLRVPWYDALAFCRWLSERVGIPVTLPSEAEWEKAARGTDGRIYPWGDEPPDEGRCNFGGNVVGTTPVGRYSPQGDSPYGCADMAGNVWEWTRSLWGEDWEKPDFKYPYDPEDGREDLEAGRNVRRVLRGGGFDYGERFVRCAARRRLSPLYWNGVYGFRFVASPVRL